MLSRTIRASWDLLTMTSLSLTAVCIRLTLEWSLEEKWDALKDLVSADLSVTEKPAVSAHGLMLSMSLKPSGVEQPECVALYCVVFSLVQVIWMRRWCSELPPPPLAARSRSPPSVSSSSSEPMLVRRSMELRSFTSWAWRVKTHKHALSHLFFQPFLPPHWKTSLFYSHSWLLLLSVSLYLSVSVSSGGVWREGSRTFVPGGKIRLQKTQGHLTPQNQTQPASTLVGTEAQLQGHGSK